MTNDDIRARLQARAQERRDEARHRPADESSARSVVPRRGRGRSMAAVRLVLLIVVAVGIAFGLRAYVVQPYWIPSQSMEPTLHGCAGCNPDRVLVDKLSYRLHAVHRGDVVVFDRPPNLSTNDPVLVKRVVALAGETLLIRDGKVHIDDRVLSEPYINPSCEPMPDYGPITVPAGDVFVMGDNRCDSTDSRIFGPIKTSSIIGRAFVIFWPLGRIHWL